MKYISMSYPAIKAGIAWDMIACTKKGTLYLDNSMEYILNFRWSEGQVVPVVAPTPQPIPVRCQVLYLDRR